MVLQSPNYFGSEVIRERQISREEKKKLQTLGSMATAPGADCAEPASTETAGYGSLRLHPGAQAATERRLGQDVPLEKIPARHAEEEEHAGE